MNIPQRLRALSAEIAELQTEIRILDEQIEFQSSVTEDARIRALVSETPLADREAQVADGDLARIIRSKEEAMKRLEQLRAEQDGLLERMVQDDRNR